MYESFRTLTETEFSVNSLKVHYPATPQTTFNNNDDEFIFLVYKKEFLLKWGREKAIVPRAP